MATITLQFDVDATKEEIETILCAGQPEVTPECVKRELGVCLIPRFFQRLQNSLLKRLGYPVNRSVAPKNINIIIE